MSMICRILAIVVTVWAIGIYVSSADPERSMGLGTQVADFGPA